MTGKKVLIVEDESLLALAMSITLERAGYEVVGTVTNGESAVKEAERWQPDIILMDIMLKGRMDGIEAAKAIAGRQKTLIIYVTGNTDELTYKKAVHAGHAGYLKKPVEEEELISVMRQSLIGGTHRPARSANNIETL